MQESIGTTKSIGVYYNHLPLNNLRDTYKSLNLNPAFQRKSVWEIKDRQKFIATILEGMPCPTIFLFKRWDKRKRCFIDDVIDGKQRLETIFLFSKRLSPNKIQVDPKKKKKLRDWIKNQNISRLTGIEQQNFWDFKIPIGNIELKKDESDGGDQGIGDLIEAFVRINTQGKPLSQQERRNAKYIDRQFLILAKSLSKKFNDVFSMSSQQKGRMKDTEIALELLLSINKNEILDKKTAINKAMADNSKKSNKELASAKAKFLKGCKIIRKLDLGKNTRFIRKTSDFYSLFIAIMELERAGIIFERNFGKAQKELTEFSNKIAEITDAHANKKSVSSKEKTNTPFYRYWETTQRSTDSKERRRIRTDIVKEILRRAVDKQKDRNRFFSIAQKEQVWAKSRDKKCCHPDCKHKAPLRWETATIDHIIPYALGGPTDVSNAQLMCRRHNSMKRDKQNFGNFFISQKLNKIP